MSEQAALTQGEPQVPEKRKTRAHVRIKGHPLQSAIEGMLEMGLSAGAILRYAALYHPGVPMPTERGIELYREREHIEPLDRKSIATTEFGKEPKHLTVDIVAREIELLELMSARISDLRKEEKADKVVRDRLDGKLTMYAALIKQHRETLQSIGALKTVKAGGGDGDDASGKGAQGGAGALPSGLARLSVEMASEEWLALLKAGLGVTPRGEAPVVVDLVAETIPQAALPAPAPVMRRHDADDEVEE